MNEKPKREICCALVAENARSGTPTPFSTLKDEAALEASRTLVSEISRSFPEIKLSMQQWGQLQATLQVAIGKAILHSAYLPSEIEHAKECLLNKARNA